MAQRISPFLNPGPATAAGSLAIIQLSRDQYQPVYLVDSKGTHDGYAEGAVVNTRFGSFPHSTMLDKPWGSQIRASEVDTGSRGRKRKRQGTDDNAAGVENGVDLGAIQDDGAAMGTKEAVTAASGFVYILPPTPEIWTSSLPHRTQVVYAPDYSYILHRIRVRPGTQLIEAGAGSGSFTHAAARAVYNGYPQTSEGRKGKVFSFEFHPQRCAKMRQEIDDHCLGGIVQITHRDVYNDGFLVDAKSVEAEAVFLDLPVPWEALPHLSRRKPQLDADNETATDVVGSEAAETQWMSPLSPTKSVYLCTFSPCIEQVTRTVSALRRLGWRDIEMVEVAHRKIQVYRERIGLGYHDVRGVTPVPKDVNEALWKLREIEEKDRRSRATRAANGNASEVLEGGVDATGSKRDDTSADLAGAAKSWMQGRLETRCEPEIKTHTSYLVFAVLPREWTDEDEEAAAARWPCGREKEVIGGEDRQSRKQAKREMLSVKKISR